MPSRYSGTTRSQQSRRRAMNARRYRGVANTLADRGGVSTRELQSSNEGRFGRSANYRNYGVQSNGQSIRGRLGEQLSSRGTGNAVAGAQHRARYRQVRQALGLSAG